MEREGKKGQAAFPSRGETVWLELAIGMYGEGNRNGRGVVPCIVTLYADVGCRQRATVTRELDCLLWLGGRG